MTILGKKTYFCCRIKRSCC